MNRLTIIASFVLLAGCNILKTEVNREYAESPAWKADAKKTPTLYTTADVRIVTKRIHPVLGNEVLCTEPSPDVSKALSEVAKLNAGATKGPVDTSVGLGAGTSEELVQLAGRTTALLAFRDGVFRACEAYANGSLGADLYTLVAGNYTQLLSTLFLAQDMTGVVGTAGGALATAPTINLDTSNASSGSDTKKSSTDDGTSSGVNNKATPSSPSGGSPSKTTPAPTGSPASAAADPSTATAQANGAKQAGTTTKGTGNATAATVSVPAGAGINLVRMNEDYLGAAYNFPAALFLLCVNENDPTRKKGDKANDYLNGMCDGLKTPAQMGTLMVAYADFVSAMQKAAPSVNPNVQTAVPVTKANTTPTPTATKNVSSAKAAIEKVQVALNKTACNGVKVDGVLGSTTEIALKCFQSSQGLPITGKLDSATTNALDKIEVQQGH